MLPEKINHRQEPLFICFFNTIIIKYLRLPTTATDLEYSGIFHSHRKGS